MIHKAEGEGKNNKELAAGLVGENVFRVQRTPTIAPYTYPAIFVYTNSLIDKNPIAFLKDYILRHREDNFENDYIKRFIHIMNLPALQKHGLGVSYDVDERFRTLIGPMMYRYEGTVRNPDGSFVLTIPDDCYHTITLDVSEEAQLLEEPQRIRERLEDRLLLTKMLDFQRSNRSIIQ